MRRAWGAAARAGCTPSAHLGGCARGSCLVHRRGALGHASIGVRRRRRPRPALWGAGGAHGIARRAGGRSESLLALGVACRGSTARGGAPGRGGRCWRCRQPLWLACHALRRPRACRRPLSAACMLRDASQLRSARLGRRAHALSGCWAGPGRGSMGRWRGPALADRLRLGAGGGGGGGGGAAAAPSPAGTDCGGPACAARQRRARAAARGRRGAGALAGSRGVARRVARRLGGRRIAAAAAERDKAAE